MALFSFISLSNIAIVFCTFILVVLAKQLIDALRPNLPPGPWGLPFVGYLLHLQPDRIHKQYQELGEKYGDVVSIKLGQQMTVVLNSSQTMKDVFKLQEATERPYSPLFQVFIDGGESSLAFNSGPGWKFSRKIGARAVGIFGSSKNSKLEHLVQAKVGEMKIRFKESGGQPVVTKDILMPHITELVSHLSYGVELQAGDPLAAKMQGYYAIFMKIMGGIWFTDYFPFTRFFVPGAFKQLRKTMEEFVSTIVSIMDRHERNSTVETLADAILKAADQTTDEEKKELCMTTDDIRRIGIDLYDAAVFTTSENLEWILLLLAAFPDKQEKIHEELKSVIGTRQASINDESSLPYVKAVVTEGLRFVSNTAIGLPRMASSDIVINGFVIPTGATIIGNIWAINHDPKTFERPMEFLPERFIKNGVFHQKLAEELVVFSVGKRRCIGENMAKQELFLMTALLMQSFKVNVDSESQQDSLLDGVMTMSIAAKPQAYFHCVGVVQL